MLHCTSIAIGMDAIIKTIVNSRAFLNPSLFTNKTIMTVIERAKEITERMIMMRMRIFCKLDCSGSPAQYTFGKTRKTRSGQITKQPLTKGKRTLWKKKNNNDSLPFRLIVLPCNMDAVLQKTCLICFMCVMCLVCLICV